MKKHRYLHTGLIAALTLALSVACIPSALALTQEEGAKETAPKATALSLAESTAAYEKSEVVYASLGANGVPKAIYVVNRFDVEKAGTIVDHGDYSAVQNLTNETELARKGNATAFEVDPGTFYYQGDSVQTTLPWNVMLTYKLDGKTVKPNELAGATGKLTIHGATTQNEAVDPAFFDSFMMQATFTLSGDSCTNISASEGATIASAGQDSTVAFTVLPGQEADFELTADVSDFSMAGAQIAALPYSSVIEMPDTTEMTDGMSDLSSAVNQLTEGTASLASGVDGLTSGAQSLSSGAVAFGEGLSQLDGSSSALVSASAQINSALSQIAAGLSSADFSSVDQLTQLPAGLNALADGLEQVRQSSSAVKAGYDQARTALEGALAKIPDPASSDGEAIQNLAVLAATKGTAGDVAIAKKLSETYAAAQEVKGTYAATQEAFVGVSTLLDSLSADAQSGGALAMSIAALRTMASSIDVDSLSAQVDGLSTLATGISQLSGQYGQFHEGLVQYTSGLSALSSNYCALESGVDQLASGTGQLASGAGTLANGMGTLNATTITLPETMKEQIAEMTADFDFPEFEPVSFVSSENKSVGAVQFVMTTEAIEKQEVEAVEEPETEPSFWDRFVALF